MSVLFEPQYHNQKAAHVFVEAHIWPNGRVCPHCGVFDKSGPLKGKSTRISIYKCYAFREAFTIKVGLFSRQATPSCISGCRQCSCSARPRRESAATSFTALSASLLKLLGS
jgi:hypothetical protein